ncbi:MAG TPA: glycosyltransferase, partial [Tepidisphaeraceae bacterium]
FGSEAQARRGEGRGGGPSARIGFIGRLDSIKRIPDLVCAVPLLEGHFTLHIFGEGRDRSNIEAEITRLNLSNRVTLHGSIAKPQAALEQIDLLVLPSEAEGFGLVLIEAMAAGIPVVGTDVMGIRDVVTNGVNGLLVPVGRPDELAGAIRRIIESGSLRQRLIQAGIDTVRSRFDWSVVLPQYRALLKLDEP